MKKCKWALKDEDSYYETDCDNAFTFFDGHIEDNNFKFCPFRGREIVEVLDEKIS